MPTLIIAGNNVLNISGKVIPGDGQAPDFRIAGQLAGGVLSSSGYGGQFAPVDEGMESNQLLTDDDSMGGVSLLARLDRDVLSEPDVGGVVIDEGLQDVLGGASSADVENAYAALVTELSAQPGFGIPVILADLTPCGGNSLCTSAVDGNRSAVNTFLDTSAQLNSAAAPAAIVSFDQAVSNNATPEALASGDGESDDVNLAPSGYAAAAQTLGPQIFSLTATPLTLPPAP